MLQQLGGTDCRSIGKSEQVVAQVLANPKLFDVVFDGMLSDNAILRMRCALTGLLCGKGLSARRRKLLR